MGKKNKNHFDEVDGINPYEHKAFSRLSDDMALSKVYQGLSADAKNVLSICKLCRQFHTKRDSYLLGNPLCFYFNRNLQERYGLKNPNKTRKALAELVQYGFLDVRENNANRKTKNIYAFSSKWRHLEKAGEIELSPAAKTFIQGRRKV